MMINTWGQGTWGIGYWGSETYNIAPRNRNIRQAEANWDSPVDFSPGSNTYKLFRALLTVNDRMDVDLEEIYEQHHIESATGDDLDKFGRLVNVERQSGEGDERYRARIKALFRASTMGATFDQFTEYCASVLSTDIQNIEINTNYDPNPATVNVSADPSIYTQLNLTNQDVQELLGGGVPAGHSVQVIERGTLRLKSDGEIDDPSIGLTSDSIDTGGTLAGDLL